jgi:hypothetical protein
MSPPYMNQLLADPAQYQAAIEALLEEYKVQPVGNGYIDLIIARSRVGELARELARLPVVVNTLSWWCHCTVESTKRLGCPHGYGGPENRFGEGWFSECIHYPWFDVTEHGIELHEISVEPDVLAEACSRIVCDYIDHRLVSERFYSECLHPGLWLHVPDYWVRQRYFSQP